MLDDIKKKLAEMTLDYAKNHIGRNNAEQQQAKEELCLIMESIKILQKESDMLILSGKALRKRMEEMEPISGKAYSNLLNDRSDIQKDVEDVILTRKGTGYPFHYVKEKNS